MPPKVCFFAWEVWWGKVLTMEQLRKRDFQMASWCLLCGRTKENLDHLLLHCHSIWSLWGGIISIPGLSWACLLSAKELLEGWNYSTIRKKTKKLWMAAPLYLFWAIFGGRGIG